MVAKITEALEKGVSFLSQHQYPNGEFCCYISSDPKMQEWSVADTTVFPTALMANCLSFVEAQSTLVQQMLEQTTHFLLYQKERGDVWKHYTKWHKLYPFIPPDVDDTACASVFLSKRPGIKQPSNLAMFLANRNKKGLFYTWFVFRLKKTTHGPYWRLTSKEFLHPISTFLFWKNNDCNRNDVDGVVNANALYWLGENDYTKPAIEFLLKIIAENRESNCDKWYPNALVVYYFITRNYYKGVTSLEPARQPIIDRINKACATDGHIGETVLDTALGIISLLNLKADKSLLELPVSFLLKSQLRHGEWQRSVLYYSGPKKAVGWGSEELTTSFCLEALGRYKALLD